MQELLERIARLRLLVVGDLILDHYILGDASRISPEAPVPVVEVERDQWVPGGAANVAANLAALGVATELVGPLGTDAAGQTMAELCRGQGIGYDEAWRQEGVPTILKTRVVVRRQQLCRIDREAPPAAYRLDLARQAERLEEKVARADAVIVSDYAKGGIDDPLLRALKEMAARHRVFLACDPKPRRLLDFRGFDLITPNRAESLQLAGLDLAAPEPYPAPEVCHRIHERFAPRHLIVTLGAQGMLLSREGRVEALLPTFAREVFDVSGAGDTAVAVLTAALAADAPMSEAARLANTAAGVVVGKVGTATATPAEILAYASGLSR